MSEQQSPVSIELSAKAEASLQLKGEIPTSALGRAVNAVVDAFSPFTERRGLRGDELRLQREDVLLAIAAKARARVSLENAPIFSFPPKILVPLLEKASLEDIESELVDWWANLITSGATDESFQHPLFAEFLSKIRASEAKFLAEIYSRVKIDNSEFAPENFINLFKVFVSEPLVYPVSIEHVKEQEFKDLFSEKMLDLNKKAAASGKFIVSARFQAIGIEFIFITNDKINNTSKHEIIDTCSVIGLMEKKNYSLSTTTPFIGEYRTEIETAEITSIGMRFLMACLHRTSDSIKGAL